MKKIRFLQHVAQSSKPQSLDPFFRTDTTESRRIEAWLLIYVFIGRVIP